MYLRARIAVIVLSCRGRLELLAAWGVWKSREASFVLMSNIAGPGGQKVHIYGPQRGEASLANQDLIALRAGGAPFEGDCEKGLVAMRAEARKIQ